MKKVILIVFAAIAGVAIGQTVQTYDSRFSSQPTNGLAGAELVNIGITDTTINASYQSWMRSVEAPALLDLATRQGVTITGTLAAARSALAAKIDDLPDVQREKRIMGNRTSAAFTTMTNQLAQYDGHYSDLTNLIATANFANTNQMRNLLTKQRQALDDCHDALVKVVQVLLRSVEDQK